MARIRTFIAVDLGAGVKDRLTKLQETLGRSATGVKWVRPQNMHLTLLFLGEVDQLEVVSDLPRGAGPRPASTRPFTLAVEGVGAFPEYSPAEDSLDRDHRGRRMNSGPCTPTWKRGCSTSAATAAKIGRTRLTSPWAG